MRDVVERICQELVCHMHRLIIVNQVVRQGLCINDVTVQQFKHDVACVGVLFVE